ncbi:G2/mitotic-specific cyclin-B3 [Culicoides brevitarsis]|uniref:G2/mitotic-specific cyclin-B3 n=1 Tax=Culicoides brevitarsis TaxID=469753 RepID=UPI00307BB6B9
MKPTNVFKTGVASIPNKLGISTRSKTALSQTTLKATKRKADASPPGERRKRSALGNLTNANATNLPLNEKNTNVQKTFLGIQKTKNTRAITSIKEENENNPKLVAPKEPTAKIQTRASLKLQPVVTQCVAPKLPTKPTLLQKPKDDFMKPTRRLSNDFEKSENSLYVSALEDLTSTETTTTEFHTGIGEKLQTSIPKISSLPKDVVDFDKENWDDPFQVSNYAMDIFNYLKEREAKFVMKDYMHEQKHISKWMRALLVDWMVEVQESFELNHETLYLAVKLVDSFLCHTVVQKDALQLLGAASLLIACKFDERTPPLVEDFLYICDGAYKQKELLNMEMELLRTVGYDLSMPLSYRFLRRYARCAKVSMPILTLARFILEFSLMDYTMIHLSDSKLACAALFIALRMNKMKGWNATLEYYSGYKLAEFENIVQLLNNSLHKKPKDSLNTIRNKYSHKIFHEVAKIPLMTITELFVDSELAENK